MNKKPIYGILGIIVAALAAWFILKNQWNTGQNSEPALAAISGAGASFPYPAYAKWSSAYKSETGTGLNYQSIGSGGGIAQIKAGTVTFGASDMPLKGAELEAAGLIQFPTLMGGIVPVVNVAGVAPGQLVLNDDILAGIFLGKILKWNDPSIQKRNPGIVLPNQAITVVHRSDGSGTTHIFTTYLSEVSDEWAHKVSAATAVNWPVGIGAKGNEGVASNVARNQGAIGYVEYAYAKTNKLSHTRLVNKSGDVVEPSLTSFGLAAEHADWDKADSFGVNLTNREGQGVWPIVSATFILIHKKPANVEMANATLGFFAWTYDKGDDMAKELDYVPLPDNVVEMVKQAWEKDVEGFASVTSPGVNNPWKTKPQDYVVLGTFKGFLPCADCEGIDTTLTLTKYGPHIAEGVYELSEIYKGKNGKVFAAKGNWTTLKGTDKDDNATVYQLNPDGPDAARYFEKISEATIRLLDTQGHVIASDDAPSDLTKTGTQ